MVKVPESRNGWKNSGARISVRNPAINQRDARAANGQVQLAKDRKSQKPRPEQWRGEVKNSVRRRRGRPDAGLPWCVGAKSCGSMANIVRFRAATVERRSVSIPRRRSK